MVCSTSQIHIKVLWILSEQTRYTAIHDCSLVHGLLHNLSSCYMLALGNWCYGNPILHNFRAKILPLHCTHTHTHACILYIYIDIKDEERRHIMLHWSHGQLDQHPDMIDHRRSNIKCLPNTRTAVHCWVWPHTHIYTHADHCSNC
jgi:hypothetical protein